MSNYLKPEELPNFYPSSLAINDTPAGLRRSVVADATKEVAAAQRMTPVEWEELEILRRLKLALTATLADLRKDLLFISTVARMEQRQEDSVLRQPGIKGNTPASMIRYKAGSCLNKIDQVLEVTYELQTPIAEEDHHAEL